MSGKFTKNQTAAAPGRKNKGGKKPSLLKRILVTLGILLAVLFSVFVVLLIHIDKIVPDETAPDTTTASGAFVENTTQTLPMATEPGAALMMGSVDLGSGVTVTEMLSYTGAFMEDRSDEVVTGVLAIRVTNHGGEAVQLMDIVLTDGVVNATFSLSTLMPGDTVIVLEKDRMLYKDAPVFTDSYPASVAIFQDVPGKCEDQLEIQCLNGILNVTNISGEDIAGDIVIYYKNQIQGIYYGGITYRLRIEGGLKAGEIRQGMAAHFNPTNSTVVFVTCG